MAILRKNRINTPSSSPTRDDQSNTAQRGSRATLRALFTNSPTSLAAIAPILSSQSTGNSNTRNGNASSNNFNPKLIFSQIFAIQSLHYLFLSFLYQISYVLTGSSITIDRIFTTKYLQLWTKEGWIDNTAILISSLMGAVLLALIVEKSKKCLDFSITLFSVHF